MQGMRPVCVRMSQKCSGNFQEGNAKGYFPAYQARPEDCIFCAICCTMCPDVAITITEFAEETAAMQA